MAHQDVKADVSDIVNDPKLATADKINLLERMHESVRAEMRAATESTMVDDNDVGEELKTIELALDDLASDPAAPEDGRGATL